MPFFKQRKWTVFEWDPDYLFKCVAESGTMHILKFAAPEINNAWFPDRAYILTFWQGTHQKVTHFHCLQKRSVVYLEFTYVHNGHSVTTTVVMPQSVCDIFDCFNSLTNIENRSIW